MDTNKKYKSIVELLDSTMPKIGDLRKQLERYMHIFTEAQSRSVDHDLHAFTLTFNQLKKLRGIIHNSGVRLGDSTNTIASSSDECIHADVLKYMTSYCSKAKCELILFPEYTQNLDLHYHGILLASVCSAAKFKKYWQRNYGFAKVSKLTSVSNWCNYIAKDFKVMNKDYFPISITRP